MLLWGCAATAASGLPQRQLGRVWHDYRALPEQRALVVAGDLRRQRWVSGASGGHASAADAEEAALQECKRRRALRRIQAPCLVYAVGDEVVWPLP